MVGLRWVAVLCALASAGCLQASLVETPQEVQRTPTVVLQGDDPEDQMVFTAVEADVGWGSLGMKAEPEGTRVTVGTVDGEAEPVGLVPTEFRSPSSLPGDVFAGDYLRLCAIEGTVGPVTYTLAHLETNTVVFVTTFADVAACP